LKNKIRILKFSGDVDAIVPITGTMFWIDKLQKELCKLLNYFSIGHIKTMETLVC
jgi:uncharacterized protein (DUF111 family)